MANRRSPDAAIHKANALADAAALQARTVRETAGELLQASRETTIHPSDVVGGLIGGAGAGAAAIYFIGLATLSAVAIPFIAAVGLGVGVLVVRGPRAIAADRERRTKAITAASSVDHPRLLREEIEAAEAAGAPDYIIDQLWQRYAEKLAPPIMNNAHLTAPKPTLALPPGDSGQIGE
jgi:predicted lipid-binding transport protein (Tim44 family)